MYMACLPIMIGGMEASLRRFAHYDYWDDAVRRSVLFDSGADLLIYGMGDKVICEVAKAMRNGYNANLLRKLRQVSFVADEGYVSRLPENTLRLNSYEKCVSDADAFCDNFVKMEVESNRLEQDSVIVEPVGDRYVVVNPPYTQLSQEELDNSFDLPSTLQGKDHPSV